MSETRKLDPDEIPLPPIAQKDGGTMSLKCRTLGEAFLICEELEKADILAILPPEDELEAQFKRDGYVEVRVSAKTYESLADLRSTVEFQYKRLRADQPLPTHGKLLGMFLGVMIVPGPFVFVWLLKSYRKDGFNRMAKEFKISFFLGLAIWLVLLIINVVFSK
jgi:hypothetical protein